MTTLKVRRKLTTNDQYDSDIVNETMKVVYAYHDTDDNVLLTHGPVNRGLININFFLGELAVVTSTKEAIRTAHAVLMTLAWLLCVPMGIFLARFQFIESWFPVHIGTMSLGMVMMVVAFILGVVNAPDDFVQDDSLILAHAWLGLGIFVAGLVQPLLGFLADRMYDPKKANIPVWPDKIHW